MTINWSEWTGSILAYIWFLVLFSNYWFDSNYDNASRHYVMFLLKFPSRWKITLSGETFSCKSDEFFEKWRKFRPTKISLDKVSPSKIITVCINDLFPSLVHLYFNWRLLYFYWAKFLLGESDEFSFGDENLPGEEFRLTNFCPIRYFLLLFLFNSFAVFADLLPSFFTTSLCSFVLSGDFNFFFLFVMDI